MILPDRIKESCKVLRFLKSIKLFYLPFLLTLIYNSTYAQTQCCCELSGCVGAPSTGFDCDTWCALLNLGANEGNSTPYATVSDCNTACATLPVDLVSFTTVIKDDGVQLQWSTAYELNNDRFVVEKSDEGKSFYEIGVVLGSGTDGDINNYSFQDNDPTEGVQYYRLKQYDYNGSFEYSPIQSIEYLTESTYIG